MSDERPVNPDKVDMGVEYLDLDAFKPKFHKHVTIEGQKYGVMHPSDLTFDQWTELLAVDQRLVGIREDPVEAYRSGKDKVRMLIPDVPQEILDGLNPKRLLMLINYVSTEVRDAAEEQQQKLETERRGNGDAEAEGSSEAAPSDSTSAN